MQASRSLFQSTLRRTTSPSSLSHPASEKPGFLIAKKNRPFLNLWSNQSSSKAATDPSTKMASATSFYDFEPKDKKGEVYPLGDLKNKVVLVVNTASKCGFTPQFEGLEKLYKDISAKYPDEFTILGFPCNQFLSQDPGSNDDIQSFCQLNYGVSFPVLGKTDVNGPHAEPLFEWLKHEKPGLLGMKRVKWNFEKWLVGRDGKVKGRWASTTSPKSLEKDIVAEIKKARKDDDAAAAAPAAAETNGDAKQDALEAKKDEAQAPVEAAPAANPTSAVESTPAEATTA